MVKDFLDEELVNELQDNEAVVEEKIEKLYDAPTPDLLKMSLFDLIKKALDDIDNNKIEDAVSALKLAFSMEPQNIPNIQTMTDNSVSNELTNELSSAKEKLILKETELSNLQKEVDNSKQELTKKESMITKLNNEIKNYKERDVERHKELCKEVAQLEFEVGLTDNVDMRVHELVELSSKAVAELGKVTKQLLKNKRNTTYKRQTLKSTPAIHNEKTGDWKKETFKWLKAKGGY